MEAPIRTNHNGLVLLAGLAVLMSCLVIPSAVSAAPASTTASGVRTNKAIPQKRPPVAKASYSRFKLVSLPQEIAGDARSAEIVDRAKSLVGSRYRWGGISRATGFDCSGLVLYTTGRLGSLPRSANGLFRAVSKSKTMRPGDVVFFGRGWVGHTGIYAGNGQVIHASTYRTGVRVDNINTLARSLGFMGVGQI